MNSPIKSLMKLTAVASLSLGLLACGETATTKTYESAADTVVAAPEGAKTGFYGDIVLGSADAPVEIIEYASLTCPACQFFETKVLPELKEDYIDTGKVKVVFRNFTLNKVDLEAVLFTRCKDADFAVKTKQALFDRFNIWLRADDPSSALAKEARRFGMPRTAFDRCLQNRDMEKFLAEMRKGGIQNYDVTGTPSIYVNGRMMESFQLEEMKAAIEAAL